MINMNSIKNKINTFIKSEEGKKLVEQKRKEAFRKGENFGTSKTEITSKNKMKIIAEDYLQKLNEVVSQDSRSSDSLKEIVKNFTKKGSSITDISQPREVSDGIYQIDIKFNEEELKRESLSSTNKPGRRTGEGIDNILALFNNGMDIVDKGVPFGIWETYGVQTFATQHRDPLFFMQTSELIFRQENKEKYNIKQIKISDEYRK